MRIVAKFLLGLAIVAASASASVAETRVVFVTHGQSGDPYWSVVKNGMDDAAKTLGVKAEYLSPETFDMAKMAQMIDAAAASKPDGLVVSIPDAAALGEPVKNAVAAGMPVIVDRFRRLEADQGARRPALSRPVRISRPACWPASGWPRHGRQEGGLPQPGGRQLEPRRPLRRLRQGPRRRGAGGAGRHRPDRDEEPRCWPISTAHPDVEFMLGLRHHRGRAGARRARRARASTARSSSAPSICRRRSCRRSSTARCEWGIDAQQYAMGYIPVVMFDLWRSTRSRRSPTIRPGRASSPRRRRPR